MADLFRSDFSLVENAEKKHAAWGSFKRAMRGKSYDRDALNQAWSFFRAGWDDGWNAYDSAVIATGGRRVGRAIR